MRTAPKWIVGIDVRRRSDGAVAFAAWLHARTQVTLIGVHVAVREMFAALDQLAGPVHGDLRLQVELERALAEAGLAEAFARVEVVEALDVVAPLTAKCEAEGAFGLIVGRIAGQAGGETIALGAVARGLLRGLVAPIWVVPPDLTAAGIGGGAVLVAVTPGADSVGAVRVGARLASELGRAVIFVRVVDAVVEHPSLFPPGEALRAGEADLLRDAEADTRGWLMDLGAEGPLDVRRGGTLEELLAAARRHEAAFVVCGSRRLGLLGRLFSGSLSSELAARAPVPVLVVPPEAT